MWMPLPPEVLGQPVAPSSSRTSWAVCATRLTAASEQSGIGSMSIRHSSGFSTSARREFHGWNSTVDIWTAQMTLPSSVTHSSSAVRSKRGKWIFTVCSQGGAPAGIRFWWTFLLPTPPGNRCSMHGRSRRARTIPSPTLT
jgi:hypothetical protein